MCPPGSVDLAATSARRRSLVVGSRPPGRLLGRAHAHRGYGQRLEADRHGDRVLLALASTAPDTLDSRRRVRVAVRLWRQWIQQVRPPGTRLVGVRAVGLGHVVVGTDAAGDDRQPPRQLTLRIAIPARSARHAQAAVHTLWRSGPPQHPHQKLLQLYGFRRLTDGWKHTAYHARPSERAYEGKVVSPEVATERTVVCGAPLNPTAPKLPTSDQERSDV